MQTSRLVRNFYVLPCCLLLLNLCVSLVSYKAKIIHSSLLRTGFIMLMVLFGGTVIGFIMEPVIGRIVETLHQHSKRSGRLAEISFLFVLGALVYWLYYRMYIYGPKAILPRDWWNSPTG